MTTYQAEALAPLAHGEWCKEAAVMTRLMGRRLHALGWIARQSKNGKERRPIYVRITASGRRALAAHKTVVGAAVRDATGRLGSVVGHSRAAPDVVRVVWCPLEVDPWLENAVAINIRSLVLAADTRNP